MPEKHFDDGLAFLVNTLRDASRTGRNDSYDVYIPDIAREFMRAGAPRVNLSERPDYRREHENMKLHALPLYDAAWELCRRGILRPSPVCPAGQANSSFTGEGYSLTEFGRAWVKGASEQLIIPENPSRFASLVSAYVDRYGPGFAQRASEAHNCYITTNYLSCCVMCGAAAESILLATATAKCSNEEEVLAEYRSSARNKVIDQITTNIKQGLKDQFRNGCGVIDYWRDEAGHGMATSISEIEAHEALTRLLRFCQFVGSHWDTLTSR